MQEWKLEKPNLPSILSPSLPHTTFTKVKKRLVTVILISTMLASPADRYDLPTSTALVSYAFPCLDSSDSISQLQFT